MDILVCPLLVIVIRKVGSFNYGTIFQLAGREGGMVTTWRTVSRLSAA